MVQWPFRTAGVNASSPTAPALVKIACARYESTYGRVDDRLGVPEAKHATDPGRSRGQSQLKVFSHSAAHIPNE
jgi:hypothetical protein